MKQFPEIAERPAGKIPTTNVTNELARGIRSLIPTIEGGQVFDTPRSGGRSVVVRIDSNASGGGVYNVTVAIPQSNTVAGSRPTFVASSETGYLVNDYETTTHILEGHDPLGAIYCGERTSDGNRIFRVYVQRELETGCQGADS